MTVLTCLVSGLRQVVKSRNPSVALEAELSDNPPPQLPGVGGAVGMMAGHATVELPEWVRKDKRPGLLDVAVDARTALRE